VLHIFCDRSSRTRSRRFRPAILDNLGFDRTLASCDAALLRANTQPAAPILAALCDLEIAVDSQLLKRTSYFTTMSNGSHAKRIGIGCAGQYLQLGQSHSPKITACRSKATKECRSLWARREAATTTSH